MQPKRAKQYPSLSKSLFLNGLQCSKLLWLRKYRPKLLEEPDDAARQRFREGHRVGELAKGLFPGGEEADFAGTSFADQRELTRHWLAQGKVIYEAAFYYEGLLALADILVPAEDGWHLGWYLYEVKSAAIMKDLYIDDVAVQLFAARGQGVPIKRAFVVHVNKDYIRDDHLDIKKMFRIVDVTERAEARQSEIFEQLKRLRQVLAQEAEPVVALGPHCFKPYECPAKGYCWSDIPEDSVFSLRNLSAERKFAFYQAGHVRLKDLPTQGLNDKQIIQVASAEQGVHIDREKIHEFLSSLSYPLYLLDFETVQPALPPYSGLRPYRQIPFQYSLHILARDGGLEHREFLADEKSDPRRTLADALVNDISAEHLIMVFNANFEKGVLRSLAEWFPDLADSLEAMRAYIVDLHVPFQKMHYYDPAMRGSASLKSILPALIPEMETAYAQLEIRHGGMAMDAYSALPYIAEPKERERLRRALLEYCKLDTLAMVKILEKLKQMAE